jgi:Ca2+-binding EF-hand superfamily protein
MKRVILGSIAAAAVYILCAAAPLAAQDDLFSKLDKNGDGVVKADEVGEDAKGLFERALRRGDANDDKQLTMDVFAACQRESDTPRRPLGQGDAPRRPGAGDRPGPDQLSAMFDRLDGNKDGKLTKDEVPEGQRGMVERMLQATGADAIGKDQFLRFMAQRGGRGGDARPGNARPGEARPDARRPGQPGSGGFPGRPPVIATLDADNDGELSASEIEAASKALLKLDRNSDGKLTRDELFPGGPDGPPRDRPGAGRPGADRPGADRPGADRPGADRPGADRPGADRPGADRPGADRPAARRPAEGRGGPGGRFSPEEFQARLKEADANKDGKLSKDEAPPMLRERFDRIDANSDGVLDEAELKQMFERLREGADRPRRD